MRISGIALASVTVLAVSAELAGAQTPPPATSSGPNTEVTIYKVPQRSYLTQGPVATPMTNDDYAASPIFQSSIPDNPGIVGFSNYPLPGPFYLPGAYKY